MDDLSKEELEQLLGVFREQALTVLEDMSQDILTLEHNNADAEAMSRLRRSAHTIKGDSACIGLDGITELSHRMEDLIEGVRENKLIIDASLVNVLLQALDEMRSAIGAESVSDVSPDALERVLGSIAQIEAQDLPPGSWEEPEADVPGSGAGPDPALTLPPPRILQDEPVQTDRNRFTLPDSLVAIIRSCIDDGKQVYLHVASHVWVELVRAVLGEEGSAASLLFEVSPGDGADETLDLFLTSALAPEAMMSWLIGVLGEAADSTALRNRLFWMQPEAGGVGMTPVKHTARGKAAIKAAQVDEPASQRRSAEYVRVEATRIDTLLNLAGEMVIARSAMNQIMPDIEAAFPKN